MNEFLEWYESYLNSHPFWFRATLWFIVAVFMVVFVYIFIPYNPNGRWGPK